MSGETGSRKKEIGLRDASRRELPPADAFYQASDSDRFRNGGEQDDAALHGPGRLPQSVFVADLFAEENVGIKMDDLDYHVGKPSKYCYDVSKAGDWAYVVEYQSTSRPTASSDWASTRRMFARSSSGTCSMC